MLSDCVNGYASEYRIIYQKKYGLISPGICVRHKCGNNRCKNVNHLFLEPKKRPAMERFLKYVEIPTNKNLCWIWRGRLDKDGYGDFKFTKNSVRAHKASYFLHFGEFDKKLCVCHACDNPSCVNPKHLWLGTIADNNKDRDLKGRTFKSIPPIFYGKNNNKTKLNENQVIEIRDLHKQGLSYYRLSKIYPVSAPTIRHICLRKIWAWL